MALEMKVQKEITAYEAKPMFGRTWRQLGALGFMVFVGGGLFLLVTVASLNAAGADWSDPDALEQATSAAMYVMFIPLIPAALWGWYRPAGLKPEVYAQYLIRHELMRKVICYDDTYTHHSTRGAEPVPGRGPGPRDRRRTRRNRHTVSEHEA